MGDNYKITPELAEYLDRKTARENGLRTLRLAVEDIKNLADNHAEGQHEAALKAIANAAERALRLTA